MITLSSSTSDARSEALHLRRNCGRTFRDKVHRIISRRKFPQEESPQAPLPSPASGKNLNQTGGQSTASPTLVAEFPGIAYAGLKTTLEAFRGPVGIFPPLKIAVEGILSILAIVDVRIPLEQIVVLVGRLTPCCVRNVHRTVTTSRIWSVPLIISSQLSIVTRNSITSMRYITSLSSYQGLCTCLTCSML